MLDGNVASPAPAKMDSSTLISKIYEHVQIIYCLFFYDFIGGLLFCYDMLLCLVLCTCILRLIYLLSLKTTKYQVHYEGMNQTKLKLNNLKAVEAWSINLEHISVLFVHSKYVAVLCLSYDSYFILFNCNNIIFSGLKSFIFYVNLSYAWTVSSTRQLVMMPCSVLGCYQCFRGIYHLHLPLLPLRRQQGMLVRTPKYNLAYMVWTVGVV
jgi:hypothetical protein